MTTRSANHLQLVTGTEFAGNSVSAQPDPAQTEDDRAFAAAQDDRFRDLLARAEQLDAATAPRPVTGTRAGLVVPLILGLTVLLALLGDQPWQLPQRVGGAVGAVPQSLVTFLLICGALCVWAAGRAVRPERTFDSAGAVRVWWLLVIGAMVVSLTSALSLTSYAGTGERPGGLAVRCLVPLVAALLAGALAHADGRGARIRAALGTGVVTVPMTALGWSLLASSGAPAGLGDVLGMTLLSGAVPLALAVAFVAADHRRGRTPR
ncbi:hypothetical protein GCU67_18345 [Modestobacter muralis]|uniref:Uncharacterized protein n=1 Tax=Modestobacter muralis TaxID=1608614 RepID=A0A6P0HAS0_9ACTN|nr:hypothetical protein [Modestobacter muralis]NEK96110.1 hypothetical protein [Modestobacter muralis]NEN52998.1 hypothetical protein [Modestobacter muralis]